MEPTVVRPPRNPFPESYDELRRRYDVIWLAGFNNYWREAPEHWSTVIREAIESGISFVHTGSLASFHGAGERAAALDLTPIAAVLPVEVGHENDVLAKSTYRVGKESNRLASNRAGLRVQATAQAPAWLKDFDFGAFAPPSHHILQARGNARALLEMDGLPLLVAGRLGRGKTFAYMGFTPQGSMRLNDAPVIVDRAVRASDEGRLMAAVCAALLALASGEDPAAPLSELLESRARPLYETLKALAPGDWPQVTVAWKNQTSAHVQIRNGSGFIPGLRLRLDSPDIVSGRVLPLWDNQFFDLLPGETAEAGFSLIANGPQPTGSLVLVAERVGSEASRRYELRPAVH